jgi:predicted transport protein
LLDLASATTAPPGITGVKPTASLDAGGAVYKYKTISTVIAELDEEMTDRFEALRAFLEALGDDVQETVLQFYVAFKRIKNFACVEFRPTAAKILVYVKVDPGDVPLEPGFTRDVSEVGHYGTGDLEISLSKPEDLERAKPLIQRSYEAS